MWSTSPRRVKVRHLTSVHNVHDSRILRRERKSLAQAEHDVALVVGRPPREDVDGVRIVGIGAATNRFHRAFRVTWNILPRGEARASGCLPVPRPELLWVGLLLKLQDRLRRCSETDQEHVLGAPWVRRPLALVDKLAGHVGASVFDAIVAVTPAIA